MIIKVDSIDEEDLRRYEKNSTVAYAEIPNYKNVTSP